MPIFIGILFRVSNADWVITQVRKQCCGGRAGKIGLPRLHLGITPLIGLKVAFLHF